MTTIQRLIEKHRLQIQQLRAAYVPNSKVCFTREAGARIRKHPWKSQAIHLLSSRLKNWISMVMNQLQRHLSPLSSSSVGQLLQNWSQSPFHSHQSQRPNFNISQSNLHRNHLRIPQLLKTPLHFDHCLLTNSEQH